MLLKLAGTNSSIGTDANTPVPLNAIPAVALVAGNTAALWLMVKVPDAIPTAVGAKTSEILQLLAGGIDALALNTQGGSAAMVTAGLARFSARSLPSFAASVGRRTGAAAAGAMLNSGLLMLMPLKFNEALPLLVIVII